MRRSLVYPLLLTGALCACSDGGAATPFAVGVAQRAATSLARGPARFNPDRHKSWFSIEAAHKQSPVLFVSDSGTADVYIYSLPALKVVATITGFSQPQGLCSDEKGNVWIADTNSKVIYELSHHGRLENELTDTDGSPVACAWDATTGNLAVMNLFGTASNSGSVLVYAPGSQTPASYTNPAQYYYNFGGYDMNGNLFFDGRDANGGFMLSELRKGETSANTIALSGGSVDFPGMVEWNGAKHDLIVGDQSCGGGYQSCLYAVSVTSKGGRITGQTRLQNASGGQVCDFIQGVLFDNGVAGSDFDFCDSTPSLTALWPYPAGGAPTSYNEKTDSVPVGAAVSK